MKGIYLAFFYEISSYVANVFKGVLVLLPCLIVLAWMAIRGEFGMSAAAGVAIIVINLLWGPVPAYFIWMKYQYDSFADWYLAYLKGIGLCCMFTPLIFGYMGLVLSPCLGVFFYCVATGYRLGIYEMAGTAIVNIALGPAIHYGIMKILEKFGCK